MEDKYFESTIVALLENHDEFTAVNLSGHSLHGGTLEAPQQNFTHLSRRLLINFRNTDSQTR